MSLPTASARAIKAARTRRRPRLQFQDPLPAHGGCGANSAVSSRYDRSFLHLKKDGPRSNEALPDAGKFTDW